MASLSARLSQSRQQRRDFSPISWTSYFDEAHDVHTNDASNDSFRVYLKNFKPPYASARNLPEQTNSPQELEDTTRTDSDKFAQYPTIVALHGGGYSALTWAQFTQQIETHCHCRVLAIDLRGHGDTKTSDDDKMDIDTLVDDVIAIIHRVHVDICNFLETPKIVLVGHSMGGAIAIKCSSRCVEELPSLVGFVIIDVVEGTAKDALPLMLSVIKTRPSTFPSLDNAIEWCVRTGMAKNVDAARVSMPGNLLNISTGNLGIHDIKTEVEEERKCISSLKRNTFRISLENLMKKPSSQPIGLPISPRVGALRATEFAAPRPRFSGPVTDNAIQEENQDRDESWSEDVGSREEPSKQESQAYKQPPDIMKTGYCWRTDLAKTQPHWVGWFDGLSNQMLSAPVQGKFLLLAGIDRLDKILTIGQMQGKFMMKVLPKCGHAVQEDLPEQVAQVIGQFLVKNKFTPDSKA